MRKLTAGLGAALGTLALASTAYAAGAAPTIEITAGIDTWELVKDYFAAFVGASLAIAIMAVYQTVFQPVVAPNLDEASAIVKDMAENKETDAMARAKTASTVLWTNTIKMGIACLVALFFTLLL